MLTHVVLELVGRLLIHFSSRELLELLGLVGRELMDRDDSCAANYIARAVRAHEAKIAEHSTRALPSGSRNADSEGACHG